MERLKYMKETLMNCVQGQLGDLSSVNTHELGAAIDMIKDLEEAIYYCTIVESMEEQKEEQEKEKYMMPRRYMDMSQGRMYYEGREGNNTSGRRYADDRGGSYENGGNSSRREYPIEIRDAREGMSPITRRMYMESKEMHKDKNLRMQELEKYMHELTRDLAEMVDGASSEEKQMLQQKISGLAQKIV